MATMTLNELWDKLRQLSGETPLPADQFAAQVGLSQELIEKIYDRWSKMNKLAKRGDQYIFSTAKPLFEKAEPVQHIEIPTVETNQETTEQQSEQTVDEVTAPQPVIEKPKQPHAKKTNYKRYYQSKKQQPSHLGNFMRFVGAVIGTILMITSIYFTYSFNKLGMPFFWGMLLSVSIVSFMCLAFTIKSYIASKASRIGVIILWTLGILYSVFTAVSGQYNNFRKYNATDGSNIVVEQRQLVQDRIKELTERQSEILYLRDLEKDYTLNPDLKVENPQTWSLIKKGTAELKDIENELSELKNKQFDLISNDTVADTTVYHWLQQTTGVDGNIIQLITILFPALFMDLCSTICLSFALGKQK